MFHWGAELCLEMLSVLKKGVVISNLLTQEISNLE